MIIEAATTNAAATAMRSASERMKASSGDIQVVIPRRLRAVASRSSLSEALTRLAALARMRERGERMPHARLSFTSTGGPLLMV